jgi:hypothetical protein
VPEQQIVTDLRGRAYWAKWRQSLRQARRTVDMPDGWADRTRTRLRALGPIRRPVFILGCPRSGTTYLGSLLAALPNVTYFYEPPSLKHFARLVYEGAASPATVRRTYRWGLHALLLAAPGTGPRVMEKTPTHTWVAEPLLRVFPDASFVVITRDGRDTAVSLAEKPWHRRDGVESGRREPGGYLYGPYAPFYVERNRLEEFEGVSDLQRCAWIWRRHQEEVERLRGALPAGVQHHVRYEDLLREPDASIDGLLRFLGEDEPASRAALRQAARVGHVSSIGRWQEVCTPAELAVIDAEAGPLLRKLGYE